LICFCVWLISLVIHSNLDQVFSGQTVLWISNDVNLPLAISLKCLSEHSGCNSYVDRKVGDYFSCGSIIELYF
jgi:hypothetical protein